MQFTNQYKLNLIEATDTFSPQPLNENMEKVEAALKNQAASLGSLQSSVTQSVQTLQNQHSQDIAALTGAAVKIATGSYVGTNTSGSASPNTLTFDFVPKLVFVIGSTYYSFFVHGAKYGLGGTCGTASANRYVQTATWSGNTLSWYCSAANSSSGSGAVGAPAQLNSKEITYSYLAIG